MDSQLACNDYLENNHNMNVMYERAIIDIWSHLDLNDISTYILKTSEYLQEYLENPSNRIIPNKNFKISSDKEFVNGEIQKYIPIQKFNYVQAIISKIEHENYSIQNKKLVEHFLLKFNYI
jgi:hypothetical protein